VFELFKTDEVDVDDSGFLIQTRHASIIHNNNWKYSGEQLEDLKITVGYRFFLSQAVLKVDGQQIVIQMDRQNLGSAPAYPKMGQDFSLHICLLDSRGKQIIDRSVPADISTWPPSDSSAGGMTSYPISETIPLSPLIAEGDYIAGVSILDLRTGMPTDLAFGGLDQNRINILLPVTIR